MAAEDLKIQPLPYHGAELAHGKEAGDAPVALDVTAIVVTYTAV
jgi:hypothetical protein